MASGGNEYVGYTWPMGEGGEDQLGVGQIKAYFCPEVSLLLYKTKLVVGVIPGLFLKDGALERRGVSDFGFLLGFWFGSASARHHNQNLSLVSC